MSTPSQFKDLFSGQSSDYAKFRPSYPDSLFQYLASLAGGHDLAWDVGTGSGQAAIKLAEHFKQVIATDPSPKQIDNAKKHPQVEYQLGSAENSALTDQSVNIITVAQAIHWFQQERFFEEAQRVLKPNGILAFWCYSLCNITPEIDAIIYHLYKDILGSYWEKERQQVEEGYQKIRLRLKKLTTPPFAMTANWNLEHLIGYLNTWSALQTYIQKHITNPIEQIFPDLQLAWGEDQFRPIKWSLALTVAIAPNVSSQLSDASKKTPRRMGSESHE